MTPDRKDGRRLSGNVAVLGLVSLLMGMSSAMIHGLLPVFLVTVLGASIASVGLIEGIAEATISLTKVISGVASDWARRRKPLVLLGYAFSAVSKLIFPLSELASTVLIARIADRIGKGIRDAPRDALLTDVTPSGIRGAGFGLRLALYTIGAVVGPLTAIGLMVLSGDNIRLVFCIALLPAFVSVAVLHVGITEPQSVLPLDQRRLSLRRSDLAKLTSPFWQAISIATVLALARFSPAFLVLKAYDVGVTLTLVPATLIVMHMVYAAAAYPFGALADHFDRRSQLAIGALILIGAGVVLTNASSIWMTALGVGLWGLQMGVTQGLLSAAVADAAPDGMRGTAFGIYDFAVGLGTLGASAGAGMLWTIGGPALAFQVGAWLAVGALLLLWLWPPSRASRG